MSRNQLLDRYWHNSKARRMWIEGGLIFAFWTAVALLMIGSRVLEGPRFDFTQPIIAYFFLRSYWWALATPFIFMLARKFSLDHPSLFRLTAVHLIAAIVISITIETLDSLAVYLIVDPPWADRIVLNPFISLIELNFLYEWAIYLAVLAAGFARDYFIRFEERRKLTSTLQNQLTQARLDTLRMQINPHFLFNTLHAVSSLVERDPKGVRRMVSNLSDMLRYTLNEQERHEIPLEEELAVLDAYLEIQRIRFQGSLEIEMDIDPVTEEALVPPLILQPIVENAVIHGISSVTRNGEIAVEAYRENNDLVLHVTDNGPGLDPENLEKGLGLTNTEERLRGLYNEDASLELKPADSGGLRVTIRLPYHKEEVQPEPEVV